MNNPSRISELQELETWNTKFSVAGTATEGYFSKRWVAQHLFDLSDEEFLRNQREIFYDRKMAVQLDTLAETEAAAAGGAFGGAEFGDEALADEGLGGEDLGGEELGGELEAKQRLKLKNRPLF